MAARALAQRRSLADVPTASVVITNPTHFAIALRYDREKDAAPVVVAKGADVMAAKIRELARENDIPMIENPPLARALVRDVLPFEKHAPRRFGIGPPVGQVMLTSEASLACRVAAVSACAGC